MYMSSESHIIVNTDTRLKFDALHVIVQRKLKRRMSYKEFMNWLADWAINRGIEGTE